MKKISEKVIFFGNERLATGVATTAPTLQSLIDNDYDVRAVVSNYERGLSRSARHLEIAEIAKKHNIPLLLPERPAEIKNELINFGASIGVLVAYGRIVPQSVIDIFSKGIINIHPSLLPVHRGPTPLESVILDGSEKTGVSIMKLVKEMDAGPVYGQAELVLSGNETKQELADSLIDIGASMLVDLLPGILGDSIVALPQDESRATYDKLLTKNDGEIDWGKSSVQIEREIRAFAGWPKSRTTIGGKEVIITQAYAASGVGAGSKPGDITAVKETGIIMVATTDGSLCIQRLKPAGKREMTSGEFIRGYWHLVG